MKIQRPKTQIEIENSNSKLKISNCLESRTRCDSSATRAQMMLYLCRCAALLAKRYGLNIAGEHHWRRGGCGDMRIKVFVPLSFVRTRNNVPLLCIYCATLSKACCYGSSWGGNCKREHTFSLSFQRTVKQRPFSFSSVKANQCCET